MLQPRSQAVGSELSNVDVSDVESGAHPKGLNEMVTILHQHLSVPV